MGDISEGLMRFSELIRRVVREFALPMSRGGRNMTVNACAQFGRFMMKLGTVPSQ